MAKKLTQRSKKPAAKVPPAKAPKATASRPKQATGSALRQQARGIAAMLDPTPTPRVPGAFIGIYKGVQRRAALAYKEDDRNVWTVMFSENGGQRVLVKWGRDTFDANMRKAPVPFGSTLKTYPLAHALDVFLNPNAIFEPEAWRVLKRLQKGENPDEVSMDELLDETPSARTSLGRGARTTTQKLDRRAKRKAKLAAMLPADLKAWREKRNNRRKLRRANAAKKR